MGKASSPYCILQNDALAQGKKAMMVKRPFHESVVKVIAHTSRDGMEWLAMLLKTTKIPKNHDEIIAAWQRRTLQLRISSDMGVPASLNEQKREIEQAVKPDSPQELIQEVELVELVGLGEHI